MYSSYFQSQSHSDSSGKLFSRSSAFYSYDQPDNEASALKNIGFNTDIIKKILDFNFMPLPEILDENPCIAHDQLTSIRKISDKWAELYKSCIDEL